MHGLSTMQNNGVMHHLSAYFSYDQNMQEKTMEFLLRSMESAITVTKDK